MAQDATPFARSPFTTSAAREHGLGRDDLSELRRQGLIRRVVRGVYVDAAEPDSLGLRARSLSLVVPDGVVVSVRTAAWLWGAPIADLRAHQDLPPVDLTAPSGRAAPRRVMVVGHSAPLLPRDVHEFGSGLVATTPLRTAADIARLLTRPDALATLDGLLAHTALDESELLAELER
ncbi:MAG TPA: type IV toxin-antitoxin system AbiEi family antitoxin domain-containing protein, partial [Lapillicoccus sp.]|nr:type IV toxin-antitoxin system AbiEi family antitoxin domain-containing protein [Lapillicoccus sp.]